MEFRILGPIEVIGQGRQLTPRRPKQRVLLAMLLMRPNAPVPTDRLIDAVWDDTPPPTAPNALHGHVFALRKLLGAGRIETTQGGYLLRLEPGELDLERFETLLVSARRLSDPHQRAGRLREALELWRGEPLADFRYDAFAQGEIARLEELRLAALAERIEAELESGQHFELVPELERLVSAHPLRERLRGQQMLALYRSGRQAEALHVYQEGRRLLAAELGINPGPVLQALERQILVQDPALDAPRAAPPSGPRQERKRVTIVVAELVAESPQDPEDLQELVEPVLGRARAVLERFGATVQPLFANALLGVFGAPRAHEDDAERAVRGVLALGEALAEAGLEMRAGVDSGEALVTMDGERVEVTGDVLTVASRLQAAGPRRGIVVGEAAYQATNEAIEYDQAASGARLARAPRRPIRAHDFDPPESPFVGREAELALVERSCARAWRDRSVQLVTIAGEPGAGKTRLVRELRARLASSAVRHVWREGRCLPYGDGVTYWALGEVFKVQAGIFESDGPDESARKLAAAVAALVPDEDARVWLEGRLAWLVGIESTSTSGDREQAFAAWRQLLELIAAQDPLVLAFEDVHWADEALIEFVGHLIERATAPLLVLCTTRLELLDEHPDWSGGTRNATTITLAPLSDDETECLLQVLLGREVLPDEVKRAGGNPLFAHELARIAAAPAETSVVVPESIHSLIAARLDTLQPELKALASDAAVVGEVFWSGALVSMGWTDERVVEDHLHRLVRSEVIRRAGNSSVRGQSEFVFLHALLSDVAYNQIPRRARSRKHETVAEWIEQLAGERVTDHAELIAHHYGAALELVGASDENKRLAAKTRHFLVLAGDRVMALDVEAAERFYDRALELTEVDDPERTQVLTRLADAAQEAGRLLEAKTRFEEAITLLEKDGEDFLAGRAMTRLSLTLWRLGDGARHRELLDREIALLERHPLGPDLVRAWGQKARGLVIEGRPREALPWIERATQAAEQVGASDVTVRMLQFLGQAKADLGDPGGVAHLREAIQLGRTLGLGFETAVGYTNLGEQLAMEDGPGEGLRVLREAIAFSEQRGLVHNAVISRAYSTVHLFELGAWDEALVEADEVLLWDRAQGGTPVSASALYAKAEILVNRGVLTEAATVIADLLPLARQIGDLQSLVPALAVAAHFETSRGRLPAALALLEELDEATRDNPAWRSDVVAECVRVCVAGSALALAEALLEVGETSVKRRQRSMLSARATLAEARGDLDRAAALHARAAELWGEFGFTLEHAHARLGAGRTLVGLGRASYAVSRLVEARADFDRLDAPPLAGEAEGWLARALV